ncbi:two-component system activity regulator YycH [Brevibacillus ruminantium]|uniref:Two-component system activity regulator YycH n=1 Tax=Brevibacillus ruminantium TaxID=2950604 RepID=A0ABY4WHZ5_9BACL|nr:two-component system activity regulator YycH [Brevibacillus ruminantium]USG65768.1 two-component system activity regulator YycH [Brevibacillus ruminantium]
MKRWIEPAKTLLLTLLVISSFCLTALLWTNQPNLQLIEPAQYKESKPVKEKQLDELVAPESVIFHYGDDRHTKATATDGHYRLVKEEMPKWIFLDFSPYSLPIEKWEKIAREKPGIEIRFRNSIPLSVVGRLVTFRDEVRDKGKGIDRLLLYYEQDEDLVYALFILSGEEQALRSRTSISPKDLRQSYLPTGNTMPEQIMKVVHREPAVPFLEQNRSSGSIYYLPKNPVRMQSFQFSYQVIDNNQLLDAYFLDRTLVRQIVERDKTVIYTDGSRSVQLRPDQQTITFTDPATLSAAPELTDEEKVKGAVSFINKHLGWTDEFHFETIKKSYNDKDVVTFRQYIGAYPLYSKEGLPIDTIRVTMEAGQVVTMERSLIDLERYVQSKSWMAMSGPELFQYIREKGLANTDQIQNAYLSYQTVTREDYVELIPIWVVEVINYPNLYIPAQLKQRGGPEHGLE